MPNLEKVESSQNNNSESASQAQNEAFDAMKLQSAEGNARRSEPVDIIDFGDSGTLYKHVLSQVASKDPTGDRPSRAIAEEPSDNEKRSAEPNSFGPERRKREDDDTPQARMSADTYAASTGPGAENSESRQVKPNSFGPDRRQPHREWDRQAYSSESDDNETYYALSTSDDAKALLNSNSTKLLRLENETSVQDVAKQLLGTDITVDSLERLTQKLVALNGITDGSTVLKKGSEIRVPTKESEQTGQTKEYVVKRGDCLWNIAVKELGHNAKPQDVIKLVNEIARLNKIADPNKIQIGDKIKLPGDKNQPNQSPERTSPEARNLERKAEEAFKGKPEKLAEFRENMKRFEERARKDGLAPEEIAKTYREVGRLFDAKGDQPVSKSERTRLAGDVIRQAATPTAIDQGQHNTCNMNTVEVRTYKNKPSEAAKLVADVATTGQYKTKDGITVKIDAKPHGESGYAKPNPGDRSYASEIFQVTAVNIHLEKENRRNGSQLRYEQGEPLPGQPGNGERLMDYSTNPPTVIGDSPDVRVDNIGRLRDVYASITGKNEQQVIVGHSDWITDSSDGVKRVESEKELNDYLAQCKRDGKFPITVAVDTTNEPFWSDSGGGSAGGSGGGHVVNITDYEPGPPAKVTIDNSWGAKADHDGRSPISVHDLYMSMRPSDQAVDDMAKDVEWNRKHGTVDHWKEFELLRLERSTGSITEEQYERKLLEAMRQAQRDWEGKADSPDKKRSKEKLNDLVANLDGPFKFEALREQRKLGLIAESDYDMSLAKFADRARLRKEFHERHGTYSETEEKKFNDSVKELEASLKGLPANRVRKISEEMERLKKK